MPASVNFPSRINPFIEERSKLSFEFPNGELRVLPFFNNIDISETRKANYLKSEPVSRSSPIYSYIGSDSKSLNLQFRIITPLVHEKVSKNLYSLTMPNGYGYKLTQTAFDPNNPKTEEHYTIPNQSSKEYTKELEELNRLTNVYFPLRFNNNSATLSRTINFIVYWINLIRASVVNSAKTPYQGPPILRLTHGIMYQDIPCLCTGYKISKSEDGGYDVNTMLPRDIDVQLDLIEIRQGNFGKYKEATPVLRDNIAGWEVLFDGGPNTMDPLPIIR
jgi:hypothetical protein